jgi:Mrp family chromosome partitioning ATPase
MTSLDQAFIKAYTHPEYTPTATHPSLAQADAECLELDLPGQSDASLPPPRSKRNPQKSSRTVPLAVALHYDTQLASDAPPPVTEKVLEALERAPNRPADLPATTLAARISVDGVPRAEPVPSTVVPRAEPATGAAPSAEASAEPQSTIPSLLAGYQVDHFIWPEICERLSAVADAPLEQLADGLAGDLSGEGRVVAVAGCRRGEGATTLMLAAARKLARNRRRTILVDADLDDAQLARQLGIQPESGLEDVLSGRMSLAEVIVESVEDSLALLPLRGPLAATESALKYLAQDLQSLRGHYDLILLKLGPLGDGSPAAGLVVRSLARQLDTAVVVRSLRATDAEVCDAICDRLEQSGVAEVVVAENFAPVSSR